MKLTMIGRLEDCILLSYSTPAASVRRLVPAGLDLVMHRGRAFWNIVLCRVRNMRPVGLPAFFGPSYYHVAYRLYVTARLADGLSLSGLYFLRSDADRRSVSFAGNLATDFHFHSARITLDQTPRTHHWNVNSSSLGSACVTLALALAPGAPLCSPSFDSLDEANSILRYHPLGLAPDRRLRRLRLAQVFRSDDAWREFPVAVHSAHFAFLESLGQHELALERATFVAPIDYRWQLGRSAPLAPSHERANALAGDVGT